MGQFFILRSRVQQEYNGLLVNALNRIFKSNLSWNTFKWLPTKMELSCVRNIIPRSRKRLSNGYPILNQELQNHDPFGRHIPVYVMYGSTPPPRGDVTSTRYNLYGKKDKTVTTSRRLQAKGDTSSLQTGKQRYQYPCACACAELQESSISRPFVTPLYRVP